MILTLKIWHVPQGHTILKYRFHVAMLVVLMQPDLFVYNVGFWIKMIAEVLNDIVKRIFQLVRICIGVEGSIYNIYMLVLRSYTVYECMNLNIQGILI